jgi:low affinity Fe/Cu permease
MKERSMKNKIAGWLLLFLALFFICAGISQAANEEKEKADCEKLKTQINDIDKKIKRSCQDVQTLMDGLIDDWQSYYRIENQRLSIYELYNRKESETLKDFVISPDANAKVEPGQFYELFIALKNEARETGLLIDGTPPWSDKQRRAGIQVSNSEFAFAPDAKSYFYFGNAQNHEAGKAELNKKLNDIKTKWNERKKQYDEFIKSDLELANKDLASLTEKMAKAKTGYFTKADQLGKAAYSGDYEHCLGKMAPAASSYTYVDGTEKLFIKGKPDTVEGLPGMGLQFLQPTNLPVLAKINIPDCPFQLHLKRDGDKARAFVEEILKLELEKQERDSIELGITFVDETLSFAFDASFHVVEATAPLGNAMINIVSHPIDSTANGAKAVIEFGDKVLDRGYIYKIKAEGGIAQAIGTALESSAEKLGNLGSQLALRAVDSDRFTVNPDDPPQKKLEKMLEQIDSARQVNVGLKEMAKVTGEIAMLWKADAVIAKTGQAVSVAKAGVTGGKFESLANNLKALKAQNPALTAQVEAKTKSLEKIIEGQKSANDKLQILQNKVVNEPAVKPFAGQPTAPKATVQVSTAEGQNVSLNLGEQLGKGSTSTAFIDATNDSRIIRLTVLDKNAIAASKLDDFGRQALEKEVKSDSLRVAKREASYTMPGDEMGIEKAKKIEVVERVAEDAATTIKKQGGVLTEGQKMAYEQGIRDINSKGFAWVDNHTGNFSFEKLPGEDRWRVVVFDTGNIVKVTGNTAEELAKNARAMQIRVDELGKTMEGKEFWDRNAIREKILGAYNKPLVDIKAMGIDGPEKIGMAAGDVRINTGNIAKMTDQELTSSLRGKTTDAVLKTPADDVVKARKKASPVPESAQIAASLGQTAEYALLTNAPARLTTYAECVKYRKLLISGEDPAKLKKMGNPCANLNN